MKIIENEDINIYILTHKKITEHYDETLYKPLLNGSALLDEDYGYLRDDSGDNLSKLNKYLAELTGEYWVWKNSKSKIIGFCHYRRWFVKNIFLKKIDKQDIEESLKKYDIILPQKTKTIKPFMEIIKDLLRKNPDYGPSIEDYEILKKYLKENQKKYYPEYTNIMNGKEIYLNTIFICEKELADEYYTWLFSIFHDLKTKIDFSSHAEGNKRVFAFFCEILLNVYVKTNNLKIKEYYVHHSERKIPIMHFLAKKYPIIGYMEGKVIDLKIWIKN